MARILFTFAGGSGHADPLVPIADAARAAGHTTAFAGHRSGAVNAEALGFTLLGAPVGPAESPRAITPLRALDMVHEEQVLRDHYAGAEARRRATQILELIGAWRPDLIVSDEVDFGSMVAAERAGLAHVTVSVTASGSFVRPEVVAQPLDALRVEHGLAPDPTLAMPSRHLVVSPSPPSVGPFTSRSARSSTASPATSSSARSKVCETFRSRSSSPWSETSTPPGSGRNRNTCTSSDTSRDPSYFRIVIW